MRQALGVKTQHGHNRAQEQNLKKATGEDFQAFLQMIFNNDGSHFVVQWRNHYRHLIEVYDIAVKYEDLLNMISVATYTDLNPKFEKNIIEKYGSGSLVHLVYSISTRLVEAERELEEIKAKLPDPDRDAGKDENKKPADVHSVVAVAETDAEAEFESFPSEFNPFGLGLTKDRDTLQSEEE